MSAQAGSRTPDSGLPLCLPAAPRILVMAGRCAVWTLHGVLLAWVLGHVADAWETRTPAWEAIAATGLAALMSGLWWRLPSTPWLDRPLRLQAATEAGVAVGRGCSLWREGQGLQARAAGPAPAPLILRIVLDTGGGLLMQVQGPHRARVTWVPAKSLTPVLRWQLLGMGAGSAGR